MGQAMPENWVVAYRPTNGLDIVEHLDGIDWLDAPAPRRWHKHTAQTRGFFDFRWTYRCACGAFKIDETGWFLLDPPRRPTKGKKP